MDAGGLNLDYVGVTGPAIDGVEPAPMPPVISTDVAFEAFGLSVRRSREVGEIVVAVETGVCVFSLACLRRKQEASDNNGDRVVHVFAIGVVGRLIELCASRRQFPRVSR